MLWLFHPVIAQYLDPGSGNYTFQIVIAGILAFAFFFFPKIKGYYSKLTGRTKKDDQTK
jgi:hypothetical protein